MRWLAKLDPNSWTERRRAYVYRVLLAASAVAVAYGFVADDKAALLVALGTAALGGNGLATSVTSTAKVEPDGKALALGGPVAAPGHVKLPSGVKPGDLVVVTGTYGSTTGLAGPVMPKAVEGFTRLDEYLQQTPVRTSGYPDEKDDPTRPAAVNDGALEPDGSPDTQEWKVSDPEG